MGGNRKRGRQRKKAVRKKRRKPQYRDSQPLKKANSPEKIDKVIDKTRIRNACPISLDKRGTFLECIK